MAKRSFKEKLLHTKGNKKQSRSVTVRLPSELDEEVRKLSKKTNRTVSEIIIEALRFALEIPA